MTPLVLRASHGLILVVMLTLLPATAYTTPRSRGRARRVDTHAAKQAPRKAIDVKEAEQLLAKLGYWTGPVDGTWDECSRNALIAFQKVESREPTGKLTVDEV